MTKPSLDLIQVASPCPVSWDTMTSDPLFGAERKRFCRQCNLHVYNLSDMSREEAEAFISKAEGRTCVRFYRREDGTVLTRDCPVGLRAVRQRFVRSVAALAGMIAALLTGTLFAGRLKHVGENLRRPSETYAEWIEPGSTHTFNMGVWVCPTTPPVLLPVTAPILTVPIGDPPFEPAETPLLDPTPQQLEEIAERLK
jgi:hypothetical protein